jgi:hypothetical protein
MNKDSRKAFSIERFSLLKKSRPAGNSVASSSSDIFIHKRNTVRFHFDLFIHKLQNLTGVSPWKGNSIAGEKPGFLKVCCTSSLREVVRSHAKPFPSLPPRQHQSRIGMFPEIRRRKVISKFTDRGSTREVLSNEPFLL